MNSVKVWKQRSSGRSSFCLGKAGKRKIAQERQVKNMKRKLWLAAISLLLILAFLVFYFNYGENTEKRKEGTFVSISLNSLGH